MLTPDGRPICGTCGATPKARRTMQPADADPRYDAWGWRELTAAEYEQHARAGGWHMSHGQTHGGQAYDDALCPKCARPDPVTVRLCRELERELR
jgi:hypothetical protein